MHLVCYKLHQFSKLLCLHFQPRDGEPKVRMLTEESISVIDNHFAMPLGKTDQLKAPENFPLAVYRYTLREMSLVWHMYGGNDFSSSLLSKYHFCCDTCIVY